MNPLPTEPKKAKTLVWVFIVLLLLFILSGGFFFWRSFVFDTEDEVNPQLENALANAEERFAANANGQLTNTTTAASNNNATNGSSGSSVNTNSANQTASTIAGTWVSDCLVPDVNSSWSEKHQFVINADGTAVHTRWSGSDHSCTAEDTFVTTYSYTIPQPGQINLTDRDSGSTMYDIYLVSGNTLKFGHGFQSPYPPGYDASQGFSAAKRFHDINSYIVYKK